MRDEHPCTSLRPLVIGWLALVLLTLLSLGLGRWLHGTAALPVIVAAIVWIKGSLVASRFIEAGSARPFIRRVVRVFVACSPLALIFIAFFGSHIARWTVL